MRLARLAEARSPELEALERERGFVSDILRVLTYRPELFGAPFSQLLQEVMRGPSSWSVGERELFAAFVSSQNQCRF